MNCSRPPPDPTGSYEIVTSWLESWKPAIQACWAASWALEPAPARLPDRSAVFSAPPPLPLEGGVVASSLSPHAATLSASATVTAVATGVNRLNIIEPFLLRDMSRRPCQAGDRKSVTG